MVPAIVEVEHLGKRFRKGGGVRYHALRDSIARAVRAPFRAREVARPDDEFWGLEDVSLKIHEGEVVGIVGRNGAGKSTLLKILSGILRPTTGRAIVRGRVGTLLEIGTGFHPELTGRENLYLYGAVLGMRRREIARKYDMIVEFAGVEEFIDMPLKHYSSGMAMRLAFAVAAHLETEILLVDEVLAVGDAAFQKRCLGKMQEISEGGRTVLFVSHQLSQLRRLCDKGFWLDGGRLRMEGPIHEVLGTYEASTIAVRPNEPTRRSERVEFTQWQLQGEGAVGTHAIGTFGPVRVCVRARFQEAIRAGQYLLRLYDSDGSLVWGVTEDALTIEKGECDLMHEVPTLPLRPGAYQLQAVFYDGHAWGEPWWFATPLTVRTAPTSSAKDEHAGVLNLPRTFHVRSAP